MVSRYAVLAMVCLAIDVLSFPVCGAGAESASWIWSDGHGVARVFRNVFTNAEDSVVEMDVTADVHYVLKFDGVIVGRGPDLSVPEDWLYRTYVLPASVGEHVVEAVVYHGGSRPYSQTSCRAGFLVKGHGAFDEVLTTGRGPWRAADVVNVDYGGETGGAFGVGLPNVVHGSSPEAVSPPDAAFGPVTTVRAGEVARSPYYHVFPPWRISPTGLLPPVSRRFDSPLAVFPLFVPAHSRRVVDIPLGGYFCAYPILGTKGGKGAKVRLAWSESAGKIAQGIVFEDTFLPDGGRGKFTTSLFRCGTICRLSVETGDEPLSVESLVFDETHYPVDGGGRFACDDPSLEGVFRICRRGLEMCAHGGGVYDCPFYERLVYLGDTRVQFLAQNALSSDGRLQRRVLEMFSRSRGPGGIMPMNFPCDGPQSPSATYTLVYPLELDDYMMWHGDLPWVSAQLPGLVATMEGLARFENADALLENLPGWCFVDWSEWASGGAHLGAGPEAGSLSCIENLFYVLALDAASRVAAGVGRDDLAAVYSARRAKTAAAVLLFWDEEKGAFSDDSGHSRFSEHAQALALFAGVPDDPVRRARCAAFLADAPDLTRASVYFSHYLFDAYASIGRADLIMKRLSLWRGYVERGYATPLEMPEPSRSDCHGWGAHPLYHFAASFAGVRPDAPGFERVRIAPQFASLTRIECRIPHPRGFVDVSLRRDGNRVDGTVTLPAGITGVFVWNGERCEFSGTLNVAERSCQRTSAKAVREEFPRWPSVVAMPEGHESECAADIRRQLRETSVDGILFRFTLNPEGDPVEDKAADLAQRFARMRSLLSGDEDRCGALFQATMGHGWQSEQPLPPWQRLVLRNGSEPRVFCPLDPSFLAFMKKEASTIAAQRPAFFMVDDDTRLITGRDGCFCPLHLAEMQRRTGRAFTRETLIAALDDGGDVLAVYDALLEDSVAGLLRIIRESFDEAAPGTPGAFCCCCGDVRHAAAMARILAAKGQRPVVRLNNGRYCSETARDIPDWLYKTAQQLAALPKDVIALAEPDTCPQNRYSMSAKDLDAHISLSLLEGCAGGKLWITRCRSWEPASGEAYRLRLAKRKAFYGRLLELRPRWEGVKVPLPATPPVSAVTKWKTKNWGGAVLGRFGIPYANTAAALPFAALTADDAAALSDSEIRLLLDGVLLLDADGSAELKRRGFSWTDGGNVVVFPDPLPGDVHLGAPFKFYNETRKREVIEALLSRGFSAPYAPGDEELLVKWGVSAADERILVVLDTGHDDMDELPLVFPAGAPRRIERLLDDGSWSPVVLRPGLGGKTILETYISFLEVAVFRCSGAPRVTIGTSNVKCPAPWDTEPRHDWSARRDFLFDVWRSHAPDVLGLQEPVKEYLGDIDAAFPEWDHVGVGREDGNEGGEYCPVYWRRDRFDLEESGTFWLSKTPDKPGSKWPGAHHPRICTFVFLKDKASGRRLALYNTHTSYVAKDVCAAQLAIITGHVREHAPKGAMVVVTGDLNFEDFSTALAPLHQAGLVNADMVCLSSLSGLWNSVTLYRFYPKSAPAEEVRGVILAFGGSRETLDARFSGLGSRIDHIFVSPGAAVLSCGVDDTNRDGWYPSDHMPKFATVEF